MKQYKWCAIDAEGDVGDKGLLGVSFYSADNSCYLTNHSDIRHLLLQYAERGYTFIAHNAEYDLSVIFWQLDIPIKAVYFNGRFNRGEWKFNNKRAMVQLWDTMALSGGSTLSSLGKSLGIKKYATPATLTGEDISRFRWKCDTHNQWECVECYAIQDARICYTFMQGLTETLQSWGVEPRRRLSGLASHVWRALDNPSNIAIKSKKIRSLARQAYHGGRTETFKLGTIGPIYTADVTSMYPAMMLSTPYPDPDTLMYITSTPEDNWLQNGEGVIDVTVSVPNMYLPPLPYYDADKLTYPIGQFRTCVTLRELRYAVGLGVKIHRIHRTAFSLQLIYPFQRFINTLWIMREEYIRKGDSRALFAKLLMNNLYGYLGMKEDMTRVDTYPAAPNKLIKNQPKTEWYTENGKLYLTYEREQPTRNTWTNVLWAAQTTATARITLHNLMLRQGTSLVYCDTDSIFSIAPIVGTGTGLGELRPDGDYEQALIAAPKLYGLKSYRHDMPDEWHLEPCKKHHAIKCDDCRWRAKAKGVSRDTALVFLREGVATFSQPIKPMSQSRRKIDAGTWIEVTKHKRHTTAKRQAVDSDVISSGVGWTDTRPLVV